jgi:hypothetical protein
MIENAKKHDGGIGKLNNLWVEMEISECLGGKTGGIWREIHEILEANRGF